MAAITGTAVRTGWTATAALLLGMLMAACSDPAPRRVAYGQELCEYCHMTIADPRFGGQLITRTGRIYVFDDARCLAAFVSEQKVSAKDIGSVWVNDFLAPEHLIEAAGAAYLETDSTHTPMSSGLIAIPPGPGLDSLRARLGGRLLAWGDVLQSPRKGV